MKTNIGGLLMTANLATSKKDSVCNCHDKEWQIVHRVSDHMKTNLPCGCPRQNVALVKERSINMKTTECKHNRLKVRKHRVNLFPCLHCLECGSTWSDSIRAMSYLRTKKELIGILKLRECRCLCHKDKMMAKPCFMCSADHLKEGEVVIAKPISEESWKDHELDHIWHHGLKLVKEGKMDVYDCLNVIEQQMSEALAKAHAEGVRDTLNNVGMLRQWLNEDRIRDFDKFVTNEELEHWLKDKGDK